RFLDERCRVDRRNRHFALLLDEGEKTLAFRASDDAAASDGVDHLFGEDLLAHSFLISRFRDPRPGEQLLVALEREFVAVAEPGVGGNALEYLVVRHAEMQVARLLFQQTV